MSPFAGSLSILLPVVERLTRGPGKILILAATTCDVVLLILGFLAGRTEGGAAWIPFSVGVLLALFTATFAILRHRLEKGVEATAERLAKPEGTGYRPQSDVTTTAPSSSQELTILSANDNPLPEGMEDEIKRARNLQRQADAQRESAQRKDTFFPRIEAAQRAAIAAAGGTQNAPYLKDDLRITMVSAIGTAVLIPIASFMVLVAAIIAL